MFYLQRFLNAQESGGLYDDMPNDETALHDLYKYGGTIK